MTGIGAFFRSNMGQSCGFHTTKNSNYTRPDIYKGGLKGHNITRILSWIPVLSIISGIYDLVKSNQFAAEAVVKSHKGSYEASDKYGELAASYKARAIASFCQASVFLLILDIIATAGRYSTPATA